MIITKVNLYQVHVVVDGKQRFISFIAGPCMEEQIANIIAAERFSSYEIVEIQLMQEGIVLCMKDWTKEEEE